MSQKSLTGHAKGGAAVFQMMGLCQMLRDGVIPPNRSLDCVDDELAGSAHFVWVRDTLRLGEKFPLKAGLVTSLGFGHVSRWSRWCTRRRSSPRWTPDQRADYQRRADARLLAGQRRLGLGHRRRRPMYQRPADRRFDHDAPEKRQEASMLLIRRRGWAKTAFTTSSVRRHARNQKSFGTSDNKRLCEQPQSGPIPTRKAIVSAYLGVNPTSWGPSRGPLSDWTLIRLVVRTTILPCVAISSSDSTNQTISWAVRSASVSIAGLLCR